MNFAECLAEFEKMVSKGIESGVLGKSEIVNVRENNLSRSRLALRIGNRVLSDLPFMIDFYGVQKKSDGFWRVVDRVRENGAHGYQVKSVMVPVVHMASIQAEMILAMAPSLVADFKRFKAEILTLRGFKHDLVDKDDNGLQQKS